MIVYILLSLVLATIICLVAGKRHPWVAQIGFAGIVTGSFITAAKLSPIVDGVFISASMGLYSATFLLTDFLGEVHGRKHALRAVYMGIIAEAVVLFAVLMTLSVPAAPFWRHQEAWVNTFGVAPRIMLASISAFLVAQFLDVFVFDWFKQRHGTRLLYLRNNVGTILSQTIDSVVFYPIAFLGVPGVEIVNLIAVTCVVKYAIALCDTPFIYLSRMWAERSTLGGK
jgi:queuosine precursor transporter